MKFLVKNNVDDFVINDDKVKTQSDIRHWMINHLDMSIEYETIILSEKNKEEQYHDAIQPIIKLGARMNKEYLKLKSEWFNSKLDPDNGVLNETICETDLFGFNMAEYITEENLCKLKTEYDKWVEIKELENRLNQLKSEYIK